MAGAAGLYRLAAKCRATSKACHARLISHELRSAPTKSQTEGFTSSSNGSVSQAAQGEEIRKARRTAFLPAVLAVGIIGLGIWQAQRLLKDKKEHVPEEAEPQLASEWKMACLKKLPLRFISRCWGTLASVELPIWGRRLLYNAWADAFHANLEEAALPVEEFPTLRDFFTRELRPGARSIDPDPCAVVSPSDGVILRCGVVQPGIYQVDQIKGVSYSLAALLGIDPKTTPETVKSTQLLRAVLMEQAPSEGKSPGWRSFWKKPVKEELLKEPKLEKQLHYCVVYLAPGDYHRIHSPAEWQVHCRRHFSGYLFPVNDSSVRFIRDLYVLNERVVLEGTYSGGYMALVAVGATNVGSIEIALEPGLCTNRPFAALSNQPADVHTYGIGVDVKRGEEVALFNLGSTVVLVFEAPAPSQASKGYSFTVSPGQTVRMGQALGHW